MPSEHACLEIAKDAYEDALIRGVCQEGALEAAAGALEGLSPDPGALHAAKTSGSLIQFLQQHLSDVQTPPPPADRSAPPQS